jgi:hypothetical protein
MSASTQALAARQGNPTERVDIGNRELITPRHRAASRRSDIVTAQAATIITEIGAT